MCSFHIQTTNWRRSLFGVHFLLSTFFIALFRNPFDGLRFWNMQCNTMFHHTFVVAQASACDGMEWVKIWLNLQKKPSTIFIFILHSAISIIVSKFQATFSLFFPWHTEEGEKEIFLIFNACPSSSKWISCGVKLNYIWKI